MVAQDGSCGRGTGKSTLQWEQKKLLWNDEYVPYINFGNVFTVLYIYQNKIVYMKYI